MNTKQLKRFWEKVDIKNENECWNWKAYKMKNGYGTFRFNTQTKMLSHRVSLFIKTGMWGDCALHSCDNPSCCNPNHLRYGTHAENNKDMLDRNRCNPKKGEENKSSKLTKTEVLKIRQDYITGSKTMRELAKEYNIVSSGVSDIINKKSWKHI